MREIVRRSLAIAGGEGVDALTMGRLAADLDYTPGALYRYFASKDVLVAEVQRAVVVYLGRAIAAQAEAVGDHAAREALAARDAALAAVAAAALGFADFGKRSPAAFGFLSMYLSDPEYRLAAAEARYVHEATRETLGVLAELISAAERCGALSPGDAGDRAISAWAALQGVMQTRKLERNDPGAVDVERLVRDLVRTLLAGWGATPERVDLAIETVERVGLARLPGSIDELLARPAHREKRSGKKESRP